MLARESYSAPVMLGTMMRLTAIIGLTLGISDTIKEAVKSRIVKAQRES
jgi:hypothetical protein